MTGAILVFLLIMGLVAVGVDWSMNVRRIEEGETVYEIWEEEKLKEAENGR